METMRLWGPVLQSIIRGSHPSLEKSWPWSLVLVFLSLSFPTSKDQALCLVGTTTERPPALSLPSPIHSHPDGRGTALFSALFRNAGDVPQDNLEWTALPNLSLGRLFQSQDDKWDEDGEKYICKVTINLKDLIEQFVTCQKWGKVAFPFRWEGR